MNREEQQAQLKFELLRILEGYIEELHRTKDSISMVLEFSNETAKLVRQQQVNEEGAFQTYMHAKTRFLKLFQ